MGSKPIITALALAGAVSASAHQGRSRNQGRHVDLVEKQEQENYGYMNVGYYVRWSSFPSFCHGKSMGLQIGQLVCPFPSQIYNRADKKGDLPRLSRIFNPSGSIYPPPIFIRKHVGRGNCISIGSICRYSSTSPRFLSPYSSFLNSPSLHSSRADIDDRSLMKEILLPKGI
jgi:hypothetical protein